jgi:hypothetical protein
LLIKGELDMSDIVARQLEASKVRLEIKHAMSRLEAVNWLRYGSLPIAAIAAGAAATTSPIAFPIVAGVAAAAVGVGQFFARRERAELDKRLRDLEARHVLRPEEVQKIRSTANNFTVAGSST